MTKHFNQRSSHSSVKFADKSESTKNLKRAGVRMKVRRTVFRARIFDFFDKGIMTGIQAANARRDVTETAINFTSHIVAVRKALENQSQAEALVKWTPADM